MYAGLTIRKGSGKLAGTHQKIDRVSRRYLNKIISNSHDFPGIKEILHFEGKNGPDGLIIKGTNKDDNPWHLINPIDAEDRNLLVLIDNHIFNLSEALQSKNRVRASFEAAWLSHAIVDGLTPAHHYPLNDKIEELWGKPRQEIVGNKRQRTFIKGDNVKDTIFKNWQYWGVGGVMSSHLSFEFGVASAISSDKFENCGPTKDDIVRLDKDGFETIFMETLQKVYAMNIYEEFCREGWTLGLALRIKNELIPEIIKVVTLAWYQAVLNANKNHR